jgi:Ca2+-binding RTX toxin-like protein
MQRDEAWRGSPVRLASPPLLRQRIVHIINNLNGRRPYGENAITRSSSPVRSPSFALPVRPHALAEPLEARRLLAGIESGVLVARGMGGNDTIAVRRTGTDDVIITTNGVNQTFDMDDFTGVRLEGLGGNDMFRLIDPLVSPVVRNTTVVGGAGNDTVSYATRTAAIAFSPYEQDSGTSDVFLRATSGVQQDRIDSSVETIVGGSGNDTFDVRDTRELLFDDVTAQPAQRVLDGRGGDDTFGPTFGLRATMLGGAGNDHFTLDENSAEFIFGGDGDDRISLGADGFPDFLDAGAGIDRLLVGGSHEHLFDMRLYAGLENVENVTPGGGNVVIGNEMNNYIAVSRFDEEPDGVTLRGMGGNDTLIGGHGDDSLDGGDGGDYLDGNVGDDTLVGGAGTDTVDGGPGNNTILSAEITPSALNIRIASRVLIADASWGRDRITIERTGSDDVIVRVNNTSRTFDMDDFDGVLLRGNAGWDDLRILQPIVAGSLVRKVTLEGGAGDDSLQGSSGDDVLRGGDGNDLLRSGFGGNNALSGGGGNDTLYDEGGLTFLDGGDGNDYLNSEDNAPGDTVLGGNGNDKADVDPGDEVSGVETVTVI